jgi:hypothetical protein
MTPEKDIMTKRQQEYVGMLREACNAIPEGLNIAMIVETEGGFFLLGNCCEPCSHALIHKAADMVSDPRDALVDTMSVVIIQ